MQRWWIPASSKRKLSNLPSTLILTLNSLKKCYWNLKESQALRRLSNFLRLSDAIQESATNRIVEPKDNSCLKILKLMNKLELLLTQTLECNAWTINVSHKKRMCYFPLIIQLGTCLVYTLDDSSWMKIYRYLVHEENWYHYKTVLWFETEYYGLLASMTIRASKSM